MKRRILQSNTLPSVLMSLADLTDGSFQTLLDDARGPLAFDLDIDRCKAIAAKISLDVEATQYLLSALSYLYNEVYQEGYEQEELNEIVGDIIKTAFLTENSDAESQEKQRRVQERLYIFLQRNYNMDNFRKLQKLRSGFLPNAYEFDSFIDIRPNYNEQRDEIIQFVPLVQMRIKTDSGDPTRKNMVIQLDERGLARLKLEVEKAEKKLATVFSNATISSLMVKLK